MHLPLAQRVVQARGLWLKFRFRLFYKSTKNFDTTVQTSEQKKSRGPTDRSSC